jgi:hypothetical protein
LSFERRPAVSEYLGPYDKQAHILRSADIEGIRQKAMGVDIANPLKEPVYDLLNEMAMSFLEHFIIPISSSESALVSATTLCPNRDNEKTVDHFVYHCLTDPPQEPIPGLDNASVESRIKGFLQERCAH